MKHVIVTGANGFVGCWLLKCLSENDVKAYAVIKDEHEDISLIKNLPGVEIVYCDLSHMDELPKKISKRGFDAFYHLAWVGSAGLARADYNVQLNNSRYSCDAAKAAKELGCSRFLSAGTVTENIIDDIINNSKFVVSQNMIYGICKKFTRMLLSVYCKAINLEFVWMQFSNIYGPYNRSGNLISYALSELNKGGIPEFSEGKQPYDFIYVEDVVSAIYLLGDKKLNYDFYFLGSGKPGKLRDYLEKIPVLMGGDCRISIGVRPDDGIVYNEEWFDISRLVSDTGFVPRYSFEEGLSKTVNWIKNQA